MLRDVRDLFINRQEFFRAPFPTAVPENLKNCPCSGEFPFAAWCRATPPDSPLNDKPCARRSDAKVIDALRHIADIQSDGGGVAAHHAIILPSRLRETMSTELPSRLREGLGEGTRSPEPNCTIWNSDIS